MTRFGAVRVLGEPGALSVARASSTMSAAGAVPAVVSGKPQIGVLRRPKEAILHNCEAAEGSITNRYGHTKLRAATPVAAPRPTQA